MLLIRSAAAALLFSLAGSGLASPVNFGSYVVKEAHVVPSKWTKIAPAPADHILKVDIALRQGNFAELENQLYEVSDPDSPKYGKHLTLEQTNALVKPSKDTAATVRAWLASHGVQDKHVSYSPAGDWASLSLPVAQLEAMLKTKYSIYTHEDGSVLVRAPTWSLPAHVGEHIDMISPTNSFFRPVSSRKAVPTVDAHGSGAAALAAVKKTAGNTTVAENCDPKSVTPLCLRTLYGTLDYKPKSRGLSKIALTNYLGEVSNRSDTREFLRVARPEAIKGADTFKYIVIANGTDSQAPDTPEEAANGKDGEADLDTETIISMTWPLPLTAYSTGGEPPFIPDTATPTDQNEPYLAWLQAVLKQRDIPQVISTSYDDDEQAVPRSYAVRVCNTFAQLGARGVSLFFASGDGGVGNDGTCISNDGKNRTVFLPEFPSTCPYITSVGATKNFNPEVVAYDERNGFSSGGGFSWYFDTPRYQEKEVQAYVKTVPKEYAGKYNPRGRGFPDLSGQGQRYLTFWNGKFGHVDGTSASTPAIASVFALVNDALIAAGRPTLGFLNPWLYKRGYKAFNDITSGSALGCNVTGFSATKGWDAVSGVGTPNFKSILKSLNIHDGKY
ncbi:hypothetical protein HDU89_004791 [Geranomyces variabilis]|nr:hypothetical protein HDU89_004791 [Geranomyces variabilis]